MIDREKVISEFERWCDEMDDECPVICLHALSLLKEQEVKEQISDAIHETAKQFRRQIVMCKDCKHFDVDYYCKKRAEHHFNTDWFCADGKRR